MLNKAFEEAMQGMIAMRATQDVVANNLANAETPGYQEDGILVSDFGQMYTAAIGGDPIQAGFVPAGGGITGDVHLLYKTVTSFNQGKLKQTRQPFDLAIGGKGFFTTQTRDGLHYTRNGSFSVNGEGYLVTKEGGFVMGQHGKIRIQGTDFKVKSDGTLAVDGKNTDRLRIAWFEPKDLSKVGSTDYKPINPFQWSPADRPKIIQGTLEMSTVNPIKEMVHMIAIMRAFEAGQKVEQTADSLLQKTNQIGIVKG